MEVERTRYAGSADEKGRLIEGSEHRVGPTEKFEFRGPGDTITQVVKGGYTSNYNLDFLQKELGKDGICARVYFDTRFAVDIADPESELSKKKRRLLFRHGFGYLCVPQGFSKNKEKMELLYEAALQEYFDYEKRHPRPAALQEAVIVDDKGRTRVALMTAIDTRVGGGVIGNVEQQKAELRAVAKMTEDEIKVLKLRTKLHKELRRAAQSGSPFRNPFIRTGVRQFNVRYAEAS